MGGQIEIVGASKGKIPAVRRHLSWLTEETKQVSESVVIPREEVDPRVLELEKDLHKKNEERAKANGLEYIRPHVLYLDRPAFFEVDAVRKVFEESPSFSGMLLNLSNTIVVCGRSFQDEDTDAYWTSFLLRHEMAHAGSVRKARASEPKPNFVEVDSYRTGAFVLSKRNGCLGELITEGHNSIEDSLVSGELGEKIDTWQADRYLSREETLEQRFPDGVRKYREIRDKLKACSKLPKGRILTSYSKREMANGKYEVTIFLGDDRLEY